MVQLAGIENIKRVTALAEKMIQSVPDMLRLTCPWNIQRQSRRKLRLEICVNHQSEIGG